MTPYFVWFSVSILSSSNASGHFLSRVFFLALHISFASCKAVEELEERVMPMSIKSSDRPPSLLKNINHLPFKLILLVTSRAFGTSRILVFGWHENVTTFLKDEWLPDSRINPIEVDCTRLLPHSLCNSQQDKSCCVDLVFSTGRVCCREVVLAEHSMFIKMTKQ